MYQIKDDFENLIEIQHSKFIALFHPLNSKDEVKPYLEIVNKKYPKATHYCYAYVFDGFNKSNDDGEPSSTAGKPILEVLLKNEINHAIIVVVRYFGGIKLGAGGLTRAYVNSASEVLKKSALYEEKAAYIYKLTVDYSNNDILKNYLLNQNINILNTAYEENVIYTISLDKLDDEKVKSFMQGKVISDFIEEKKVLERKI